MAVYYLDGTTLSNSTAVYDDEALTICATDGFYSNGSVVRELLNCSLQPQQDCAECVLPCGENIVPPAGGEGLYNLTFSAGANLGAIVVYFNPDTIPDGIRVLYDGTYQNAVSSPTTGRIQTTSGVADAFTILGDPTYVCTPATGIYDYFDGFAGGVWVPGNPTTQSVTINGGDDQRGGENEYSTMVIPKTNILPSNVDVQVIGPCASTGWSIDVGCPITLPSFASSVMTGSTACSAATETYYFAKRYVDKDDSLVVFPILHNWVFSDSTGATVLIDGNYVMSNSNIITVVSGVVTAVNACS